MENQITPVDVEEIMKEIRERIANRGVDEKPLSFDEAMADKVCEAGFVAETQYVDSTLHHYVFSSNQGHNIPFYQMIPKGGVKSFIKRSIRKLIAPTVLPLRDAQNVYNANVVQALIQLESYTLEKNDLLEKQEELIEQMAAKIDKLEKRIETLESR
ncbi:MAG: hypothetical protein EOM34_06750 [Clostridia bacterium]|nr:hypothetical protein [Lachnospiraceae bacterium]NCC00364.1 hypothetical protein [Clostridia bacterium]NCD02748.1 hypothetical protein [Clostridia bacterium]